MSSRHRRSCRSAAIGAQQYEVVEHLASESDALAHHVCHATSCADGQCEAEGGPAAGAGARVTFRA